MKKKQNFLFGIAFITAATSLVSLSINSINKNENNLRLLNTKKHQSQQEQQQAVDSRTATQQAETVKQKPSFDLSENDIGSIKATKFYAQNNIDMPTTINGPVLLHDNARTIAGHDWYGNVAWFITLNQENGGKKEGAIISDFKFSNANSSSIDLSKLGTKIVDVAYLQKNNYLYILTNESYLLLINALTGAIISHSEIKVNNETSSSGSSSNNKINKLAFIDFNDSLYGWNSENNNVGVHHIDSLRLTHKKVFDSSSSSNDDIKNKYIFDILPLAVGFNIVLVSDSAIKFDEAQTSSSSSPSLSTPIKLKAYFIQDDGKKFDQNPSPQCICITFPENCKDHCQADSADCCTHQASSASTTTSTIKSFKDIFAKTFKRSESSMILFVGDNVFSIDLNQSDMKSTKITKLPNVNSNTNTGSSGSSSSRTTSDAQQTLKFNEINSAIMDEQNNVFFRDNSEKLYKISPNNIVDTEIINIANNNLFDSTSAKKTRVFGVNSDQLNKSLTSTYYLAEPEKFTAVGFVQAVAKGTNFTSDNPRFNLNLSSSQQEATSPSQIRADDDINNFTLNGERNPRMDLNNTDLYANDITGEIFVRTKLEINSWYSDKANAKTNSIVIGKWDIAKVENITRWNDSNALYDIGWSYDIITDKLLTDNWEKLLILPPVIDKTKPSTQVKIIIDRDKSEKVNGADNSTTQDNTNRNTKTTNLYLIATITYLDPKGRVVSYALRNTSPFILQDVSEKYVFQFAGGDVYDTSLGSDPYNNNENGSSGKEIDVQTLGNQFTIFKNALPSLIDSSSLVLAPFVAQSKKYWVDERRVISAVADDTKGTLKITVVYNNFTTQARQVFSQVYTNFPKMADDWIVFNGKEIEETEFPKYPDGTTAYDTKSIRLITDVKNYVDFDKKLATDLKDSDVTGLFDSKLRGMGFIPSIRIERVDEEQISSDDAQFGSINLILDYSSSISSIWKVQFPESYYERFNLDQEGKITQRYIGLLPIGSTYGINLKDYNSNEIQQIVQNNNIESEFSEKQLLSTLDIKGYVFNLQSSNSNQQNNNEVVLKNFAWNGEDLTFTVHAQSNTYNTVNETKSFVISWSPKFASIRERNLIVASITSILGSTIVSVAVSIYILRRNKIRRMLK